MRSYFDKVDFELLAGQWHVQREITSPMPKSGRILTTAFIGTCLFNQQAQGQYQMNESGTLALPNRDIIAGSHAGYVYEFWQDHGIKISRTTPALGEPQLLHELNLRRGIGKAWVGEHTHQCGPDQYHLTFNMVSQKNIQMDYEVRGGQNNYNMHTTFLRR